MQSIVTRNASTMELSMTTIGAMGAGVGVLVIGLTIFIVILLVRAHREHKRHMADLEERGYAIVQTRKVAKRNSVTKPRAVLRRDTILPFNSKSGWGNLTSVETISPPEPRSVPPHYAPPKPVGFVPKPKRLSWPFLGRRVSGRAIPMRKIRVPVLSTVLESPKPSPLVPVLSGPRGEASPRKSHSRPSSDQSLLQHHPALRNQALASIPLVDEPQPEPLRRSLTAKPVSKVELYTRPARSQSLADIPGVGRPGSMTRFPRPQLHERSVSTSSQASGNPPGGGLPILPLEIARIKSEARRRSLLSRSPSRQSNSSYESAGSSILGMQPSPVMRSPNTRVHKVAKRDLRNCTIVSPRPFRDTLTLHGKNISQSSIRSSAARFSSVTPTTQAEKLGPLLPNSSSLQSVTTVRTVDSASLSKLPSPVPSLSVRDTSTPKRRSGSYVTPYGSPGDRRSRSSGLQNVSGNQSAPKRQLSQTSTRASSTRSSNDNPFQWDPAPVSAGKPSALKGSPSARKPGHKRQNCVRISLIPTMLGPQSRSPSPAIHDIAEESPQASSEKVQNVGLGFSGTRSLPSPPSTSIFAPELKFNATSIRASLAASSPTLSMANFDHGPIGTPVRSQARSSVSMQQDIQTISPASGFSLGTFPSPCHDLPQSSVMSSPPPMFALSRPSDEYEEEARPYDAMPTMSSPFEVLLDINSSPGRPLILDNYDLERPYYVHQTPSNKTTRNFSSPFSTILEESSPNPDGYEQLKSEDSPPCSPKSMPSDSCTNLHDRAYNLPIRNTTIPEEPLDTIDPAILSKVTFANLTSPFDNESGSNIQDHNGERNSTSIPTSTTTVIHSMQPLLEAAFPSSPPIQHIDISRTRAPHDSLVFDLPSLYIQSSPISISSYTSQSSPLPIAPCSPRPAYAQLPAPTPTINFAAVPTLAPSGPREPPARSLRSSIQTLRRMNSDTKKGNKAERRYTNLGREDSIALPGEESWLEDLDKYEDEEEETWDEEKGKALVGDLGFDWDEDGNAPVLDLYVDPVLTPIPAISTSASSTPTPTVNGDDKERKPVNDDDSVVEETIVEKEHPSSGPRSDHNSSIWEDGEKFWVSTPPPPPPQLNSPNKPIDRFLPLSSSPLSTRSGKKRAFEVAKDELPAQEDAIKEKTSLERDVKRDSGKYRKRSVLGVGTPNVKINIVPPSSGGLEGTPGSLYDGDGFLRG